jgi:LPS export ABC transporter protein LptC
MIIRRLLPESFLSQPLKLWLLALGPAILIFWLMTARTDLGGSSNSAGEQSLPGSVAAYESFGDGVSTRIYDQNGFLHYTLTAESQQSYANGITELDLPVVTIFEQGLERWNISAVSGRIQPGASSQSIEQLDLDNAVQIRHELGAEDDIQLNTEWLVVRPTDRQLHTQADVQVQGNGIFQRATGMTANYAANQLDFLANVEGQISRDKL